MFQTKIHSANLLKTATSRSAPISALMNALKDSIVRINVLNRKKFNLLLRIKKLTTPKCNGFVTPMNENPGC